MFSVIWLDFINAGYWSQYKFILTKWDPEHQPFALLTENWIFKQLLVLQYTEGTKA